MKKVLISSRELFKSIVFYLQDYLVILTTPCPNSKSGTLIVRLDAIGDFVLWQHTASALGNTLSCKNTEITLLANEIWSDLAKVLPYWREVWSINRKKFCTKLLYRYLMLKKIRKSGFENAVQPTYSREFYLGDSIIRVCGAKIRIGSSGDLSNINALQKKVSNQWYTRLVYVNDVITTEIERNVEFIKGLGNETIQLDSPRLQFDTAKFSSCLSMQSIVSLEYYVLVPGASWYGKRWPAEKFIELSALIYEKTRLTGVIVGGSSDKNVADVIARSYNNQLLNIVDKTTLIELAYILNKAKFVVGNDTGAIHVASALNTPSICIMGGGHFGRFLPYSKEVSNDTSPKVIHLHMPCYHCNWVCQYTLEDGESAPCLKDIQLNTVWAEVKKLFCVVK